VYIARCQSVFLSAEVSFGHFGTAKMSGQFGTGAEVSGHFGTAEMSGQFGTGAEVSYGHFGTSAEMSWVRSVLGPKCLDTYWSISAVPVSAHPPPLVITTKLAAGGHIGNMEGLLTTNINILSSTAPVGRASPPNNSNYQYGRC